MIFALILTTASWIALGVGALAIILIIVGAAYLYHSPLVILESEDKPDDSDTEETLSAP